MHFVMFKNNNKIRLNFIKLLLGLLLISFIGIEYAPDTDASNFFIKSRPTLKFEYYLPGASIWEPIETLSEKNKEEYLKYNEIVAHRDFTRKLDRFAFFIVLLATVLTTSGLVGLIVNKKTKEGALLLLDYIYQVVFAAILAALYRPSPLRNPQYDGRLIILTFFLLSIVSDYLNRTALTKSMQKKGQHNKSVHTDAG